MDVEAVDGDVDKLPAADVKEVVDLCYQCKLCFNHCPYTPPHRWEVDFPRLMLRARAAEARAERRHPPGPAASATPTSSASSGASARPLSNWMNELGVHRAFMQAVGRDPQGPEPAEVPPPDVLALVRVARPKRRARRPRAAPRRRPQGRALRDLHGRVQRAVDRPRRRARARAERRGRQPARRSAAAACRISTAAPSTRPRRSSATTCASLAAAVRDGPRDRRARARPAATCSSRSIPWLDGSEDARLVAGHTRDLFEYLARLQRATARSTRTSRKPVGAVDVPRALPPARAEHRDTSPPTCCGRFPAPSVDVVEQLLGRGRHLGLQEGVLRAVAEVGQAALRRGDDRRAGGRHRLPAGRAADRAGHGVASRSIPSSSSRAAYGLEE